MLVGIDEMCEHRIGSAHEVDVMEPLSRDRAEKNLNLLIVEGLNYHWRCGDDSLGDEIGIARRFEPARQLQGAVLSPQPLEQQARIEKIISDETAERFADVALFRRNERRVGDGKSERTTEERRDREPIRQA